MLDFLYYFFSSGGWIYLFFIMVAEFIIIKLLKLNEKSFRFLIAGFFLLATLLAGFMVTVTISLNPGIFLRLEQQGPSAILPFVLFFLNLFAFLILAGFEKFSITDLFSLKNAYVFIGVLPLAIMIVLSLTPIGWHLNGGYLSLSENFLIMTIPFVLFPMVSIVTGIAFHFASAIDKLKAEKYVE